MSHDQSDPLAPLRDAFVLPEGVCYLNGNSLGALPKQAALQIQHTVQAQWGQSLVSAWNTAGWIDWPESLGDALAQVLGAAHGQTLICDSTSINIFKLLHAALERHPKRRVIVLERDAFPTDNYIAQGLQQIRGDLQLLYCDAHELAQNLDRDDIAAALLGHVNYRSGERLPLQQLQNIATQHATPIVWDLAHSAGAIPLALDLWGVEYAVGCTYKFLNGGPGAPAFAYVAKACQRELNPLLQGWLGHQHPFAFSPEYTASDGIRRLQVGTPPIVAMAALKASLEIFEQTNINTLWGKSCALFEHFVAALRERDLLSELALLTPCKADQRGSQLSLQHPQAQAICQALAAQHNVIADFRRPGVLRFGLTPLYTRFHDIDHAVTALHSIMRTSSWRDVTFPTHHKVT